MNKALWIDGLRFNCLRPRKTTLLMLLFLLLAPAAVMASSGGGEAGGRDMTHLMTRLILQIAVIIFAARAGGQFARRMKMPSVLGELLVGIVIGPSLLGRVPLPSFPHGLFPHLNAAIPVTPELYGIATIASIILLFLAGLETDLDLFLKYSLKGGIVGIGGVIFSFGSGTALGMVLLDAPLMDPRCLFLGVLSIATSVGITARILSEHKKMESPEGVTILAAAVIDDVLGIILLAIVLGIVSVVNAGGAAGIPWGHIGLIALKAVGVWLGFTALGLLFSQRISHYLKNLGNTTTFTVMSLGMAFLLAGIFETAGLAMIIGAYVLGLSLSNTDINYILQDKLETLESFFVPVFFAVMGMMVNLEALFSARVLFFGLLYSAAAVAAKVLGSGVPSLFMNFNTKGAARIGMGMVPRGEVALIIAGIGMSSGVLTDDLFGVAIMMTLITTISAPPLLNKLLKSPERGTKKEEKNDSSVETVYDFDSAELNQLIVSSLLRNMEEEDFFVHTLELESSRIYHFRRETIFITLTEYPKSLVFATSEEDQPFIRTVVYETMLHLHNTINRIKDISKPQQMKQEDMASGKTRSIVDWYEYMSVQAISLKLWGRDKDHVLNELMDLHVRAGNITKEQKKEAMKAVVEREKTMSTGMGHGIALPHGRTDLVEKISIAVGISQQGVDFDAMDGQPCHIFILILSPETHPGPHIQVLSGVAAILNEEEAREAIMNIESRSDLIRFMVTHSMK